MFAKSCHARTKEEMHIINTHTNESQILVFQVVLAVRQNRYLALQGLHVGIKFHHLLLVRHYILIVMLQVVFVCLHGLLERLDRRETLAQCLREASDLVFRHADVVAELAGFCVGLLVTRLAAVKSIS